MQKNFTLKRIVCLLAALCLAAGLVGCADMPASSSEESSLPTILVGSDVYPPFNYIGEDGAPTGIDVELAKEAFRRMGYRAEFTIIDWERKTQLLETGDIDCVWGSFTINGREDDYRWAGPYMASRQVVAVMPGSDIETIADLEGRTGLCSRPSSARIAKYLSNAACTQASSMAISVSSVPNVVWRQWSDQ